MQKGSQTIPPHSPSITPISTHTKSKSISSHQKPPAHNKKSQIDQKPQNPQKKPKHRTNSFTPKPAKLNIFDRGFHNVNLSDTDISSKYIDMTYTNSKLKSSLHTKLDLTAKVKDVKKSKNIDKIIKKSLIRAKNQKLSQDRVNKESKIEKEIKKNEINLQNKQIRTQNLLRYKRKKKGRKKQFVKEKGRSESAIKMRNSQILNELEGKKKRSVSSVDYYQSVERRSDPEILEIIEQENKHKRFEDGFRYLDRVTAKFSNSDYSENIKKNRAKAEMNNNEVVKIGGQRMEEQEYKVERNISFIEEVSDAGLFSLHSSKNEREIGNFLSEIDNKQETGMIIQNAAASTIQKFYRQKLVSRYLNKKNKVNKTQFSGQISILPKMKILTLVKINEFLQVLPKVRVFFTQNFGVINYVPKIKTLKIEVNEPIYIKPIKNFLQIEKQPSLKIDSKSSKNSEIFEQLQEQIATNLGFINIFEQIWQDEVSLIESVTKDLKKPKAIADSVQNKYKNVAKALKNHSKQSQKQFLDSLSVKEFAKLKKTQQEIENSFRTLLKCEVPNSLLLLNNFNNEFELSGQGSSDHSSDELESIGGISHSQSLSQLLNESNQNCPPASQNPETRFPVFFNIEDQIEVQNLNFLAGELKENSSKDLPSLPTFSFTGVSQFSVDLPNSEIRILTSTDSIIDFAQEILKKIDFSSLISTLSTPLKKNPLLTLEKLNTLSIGSITGHNTIDLPIILDTDSILKLDQSESDLDSTIREIGKSDFIHKKMIILVINTLIQKLRPYGLNGEPHLWERNSKVPQIKWTGEEIRTKVLKELEIISSFQIGRIFSEEIVNMSGGIDEELIESLREEKLEKLILFEILENDGEWVCYEFEEMQVVLDLADLLMEVLADEMVGLCNF